MPSFCLSRAGCWRRTALAGGEVYTFGRSPGRSVRVSRSPTHEPTRAPTNLVVPKRVALPGAHRAVQASAGKDGSLVVVASGALCGFGLLRGWLAPRVPALKHRQVVAAAAASTGEQSLVLTLTRGRDGGAGDDEALVGFEGACIKQQALALCGHQQTQRSSAVGVQGH